jgi:PAS domain S-box-containing protein
MADQTGINGLPRAIFEGSLDGIFVIDLDGRYVDVNPAGCQMFGYTRDEFLSADVTLLIFPEDREKFLAWDRKGWADRMTIARYRMRHRDSSEVWVGMTMAPLTVGGRELVLGIKRDISDTIRAEDALRENEVKFRTLFEASTDAIFIETLEGKILDCNDVACRLYGYARDELLGLEVADLVPSEVAAGLDQVIEKHRGGGGIFIESLGARKDDSIFPTEVSTRTVTLDGELRVIVFVRDITGRRQSEQALRDSEERYRTAIEHSNDGVAIVAEARHLFVNRKYAEMFGYDRPEQLLGVELPELIHPDDRERVEELGRARQSGRRAVLTYECRGRRRDGGEIQLEVSAASIAYRDRRVSLAFLRDITARRRAEEALRVSEDKYRTLVENAVEGITLVQDGVIRFVNRRGAEFTGLPVEEIEGRPFTELLVEEDRGMVMEQHRRRLAGEVLPPYTFRIRDAAGRLRWIEIKGVEVAWEGRPAILTFLTDITDRRRLEEQLRHAQRMEAVGRLAGGVAHDFNNLLTAITGYGSLLQARFDEGDPRRQEADEILRAAGRAAELTDQLLVFSRRKVAAPEVVDLNRLVRGMENMLRRLIGVNVALETVLDPGLEAIKVDPGQMEQVLMNLVVNAQQAMSGEGQVTVRTDNVEFDVKHCRRFPAARPGRFIRLTVEDNGIGLEPEVLDHIFEPFFTTRDSGTGLGLSLVYGIITQHEGWVEVNSRQELGTVFSIFLPRYSVVPASERPRPVSLEGLQGTGERILLVEDEDAVRRYATQVLTQNGYQVFSASSAGEALKIFNEEQGNFRLVFSDQVLPGRSGLELVEQLRELKPVINVLLTSGYAGKESARKRIEEMGYPFLRKPYGTIEILTCIRDLLAGDV